MAVALNRRGHDYSAVYVDPVTDLGIVNWPLSILDLYPADHQPMPSTTGRYVIVSNGEIDYHQNLREELERSGLLRAPSRGQSDLDTLLPAIEAWGLPMIMTVRHGHSQPNGRWAIRQILAKYIPPELVVWPKMGFGIPIGTWLRGPLRTLAEDLHDAVAMHRQGLLRPKFIPTIWYQHLSGRFLRDTSLQTVLMWQVWLEEWG